MKNYSVYTYEFSSLKNAYVGYTSISLKDCDDFHYTNKDSVVYQFTQSNNIVVPRMLSLNSNLSEKDAQYCKDEYSSNMKKLGWTVYGC